MTVTIPDNLTVLNYPITTPEAEAFWASKHKCNKMKRIIAFSYDLHNANDNLRRYGYTYAWRKKALRAFGMYVNSPDMKGIPFSTLEDKWWECMPAEGYPPIPHNFTDRSEFDSSGGYGFWEEVAANHWKRNTADGWGRLYCSQGLTGVLIFECYAKLDGQPFNMYTDVPGKGFKTTHPLVEGYNRVEVTVDNIRVVLDYNGNERPVEFLGTKVWLRDDSRLSKEEVDSWIDQNMPEPYKPWEK